MEDDALITGKSDLDAQQINYLVRLNSELAALEKRLRVQATELVESLNERLEKGLIDDFNIRCELSCFIKSSDPAYDEDDEDDDGCLCEFDVPIFGENNTVLFIGLDEDWRQNRENVSGVPLLKTVKYCFLFHALLEYAELDFANLFRIGFVWADIKIDYQVFFDMSDSDKPE